MDDLSLHILIFSVILACAQSYNLLRNPSKEEVKCEDYEGKPTKELVWTKFENHANLPEGNKDIKPEFHLCQRGPDLRHIVVLIHGFNSKKSAWAAAMADTIFEGDHRQGLGILTVDWKHGAGTRGWWDFDIISAYNRAVANTRYIGLATERFIRGLGEGVTVHCIGHSLGAHACSFLANQVEQEQGRKIWRVTGLDPAGPSFTTEPVSQDAQATYQPLKSMPTDQRLDASDAEIVDVIHTDGEQWGTMVPLGHVDFYVGKSYETLGKDQANCGGVDMCDHSKSTRLFQASLIPTQEFQDIMKCQVTSDLTLSKCEQIEDKPEFGYFYEKGLESGVFGVLEQEQETKEEEEDDWWGEISTDLEKTTSMVDQELPLYETATSSITSENEDTVHQEGISFTNVIIISISVAIFCFVIVSSLTWFYMCCCKPKDVTVPDASIDALLP